MPTGFAFKLTLMQRFESKNLFGFSIGLSELTEKFPGRSRNGHLDRGKHRQL